MTGEQIAESPKFKIAHVIVNLATGGAEVMLYKLLGSMDER